MIRLFLVQEGWNVFCTIRQVADRQKNAYFFDATEPIGLDPILAQTNPDFVINASGILNKAAEENKTLAIQVNSLFPHILDDKSKEYGYKLIHISTDCVFSGVSGKYTESSNTDAVSFYGKSKALGEINNDRNITIRTSIIGPEIRRTRIGLLDWFLHQRTEIKGYTRAIWTGVTTLQLAKSIVDITNTDICGLIHLVNGQVISKYDLLLLFKKHFNKDVQIEPYSEYVSDKSLVVTRRDGRLQIPDYDIMVCELSEWMHKHPIYQ
jgi:dTDP-4-dehydrorhamnose reductase